MSSENSFVAVLIKIFFILTPFFTLSMFVAMTRDMSRTQRNSVAARTMLSNLVVCLLIYFLAYRCFISSALLWMHSGSGLEPSFS